MIVFDGVTYSYPNADEPVLRGLSLTIEDGEFVLVVGASGSGKSTLLRCLNGLVPHFYGGTVGGSLRVQGRDPVQASPRDMSALVGFVFQDPESQFVVDTVEAELAFAMENHNLPQSLMRKRVEEVLDQLDIAHLRNRRISTLSGGEKQRVAIASVLTLQPQVLVLDEPTSQLDPQAAEEVLTALQKLNDDLGLTVVLSEHRLERVVQYADRVIYMPGEGQPPLVGAPADVLADIDLAPPLVQLGKALGWRPLPLTLKEARRHARDLLQSVDAQPRKNRSDPGASDRGDTGASPEIVVRDLWHAYNGRPALKGVSLAVRRGEMVAVMGRNGSGKTTLLKHMVGLLQPDRGEVRVRDMDTRRVPLEEIIGVVGYVPQNPDALLFSDTVADELAFTRRSHGLPADDGADLLDSLGLGGCAGRYPRDLSVGERQRVALASILAAEPGIILLDEPTRGVDYVQKQALLRYLEAERARGRTVILSTHDVELAAAAADRVIILGDGEIVVDGATREVMTQSMVFASQINKLFRDDRFLTVDDVLRRL
ncbi:MAG TPA: energy-coupling factor ABC transporter ATP-binding protein [Chloroflexi bacterium]|jgi:energy-coupling factor transporter ATP-binding protein EcfA2|nr:energy-coupling factor ABC transporter ATP-binding protein [Chloroflexota bacterium]